MPGFIFVIIFKRKRQNMLKIIVDIVLVALIALWAFVILRSMWKQWKKIKSGDASAAGCYTCSAFKNGMCNHSCGEFEVKK